MRRLSTTTRTTTVRLAPVTVIGTVVVPAGARRQSTRTSTRTCLWTVPDRVLTVIHGAAVPTRYAKGTEPRLKTSMYWVGCVWYGLKRGSTGAAFEPGHAWSEPSIATPRSAVAARAMRCTAGKITSGIATLLSSGCCHGAFGPYRATSP